MLTGEAESESIKDRPGVSAWCYKHDGVHPIDDMSAEREKLFHYVSWARR